MKQKIIGKIAVKFVFEIFNSKEGESVGDQGEAYDFFIEVFDIQVSVFDWKETNRARKWIASEEKKGLMVKELDDGDDSTLLFAMKPEFWPTAEYICSILGEEFSVPELEGDE